MAGRRSQISGCSAPTCHLRRHVSVAANRLHGSIDALAQEADRFLAETRFRAPHPAPVTLAEAA